MWILLATVASALWGIEYILSEQLYKHVSVVTSLALSYIIGAIVFFFIMMSTKVWKADLTTLATSRPAAIYFIGGIVALLVAELCIGLSISEKNATIAGLIEISYPIFIVIFSFVLFKEDYLNPGTIIGGIMVFVGIAVIYFFNR